MRWWRMMWDVSFSMSSILAAFVLGLAMGNIVWGVPLDARGVFVGTFLGLLNPYSLLMGITTVALFTMHGSIYLYLKTDGRCSSSCGSGFDPRLSLLSCCTQC